MMKHIPMNTLGYKMGYLIRYVFNPDI